MENDYLWDKTGEDAELEKLEKTLQVFRYQENTPPRIPLKITETKPKFSLFSLRFALSFASCIALLLGGFFVWQKFIPKTELATLIIEQNSKNITIGRIKIESKDIPELPTGFTAKSTHINYRQKQFSAPVIRRNKTKKAMPEVVLTKEEQYAYDQLILALSITGSKFKEVRDKVNSSEENVSTIKSFK